VAGLSLCLVLVAGAVAWSVVDSDEYVAPRPPAEADPVDAVGASRTVDALQRAVADGDPADAASLAPEGDGRAAGLMAALVTNARSIPVSGLRLRYVDETSAAATDGTWGAAVAVTWRFAGFDAAPSHAEVTFRFRRDGDRVAVVGVGGGGMRTPVWMSGPLTVRRSPDTLVLSAGRPARIDDYERRARVAVTDVRAVLPQWRTGLVVEVPADDVALDAALDADPGEYAGIAAVTSSTDGSTAPGSAIHVFVNPSIYDRLGGTGAQVVMSHEAVHVATRAPSSTMPPWLLEGFADYVALRGVDLPFSVTAGQVIEQVRREGSPEALPGAAEFGSADTHLGAAYESAWLACVVLADRAGEDALVRMYAAVDGGADLIDQLEERFAWTEREFVEAWRQRLTDLAG
jgi:hypothetical protein